MLLAIFVITLLGTSLGFLLGFAAKVFAVEEENPLVKEIENMLPGSQCGQCGYPGCSSAAKAVIDGDLALNFCPPGGRALVDELVKLLGVDPLTVGDAAIPLLADIEEAQCVGCTKCLKACPTDAIVGANGQIHVVVSAACTGCKKCVEVCPEKCITMNPMQETLATWRWEKPTAA